MRIQLKLIVLSLLLPISIFAQNGKKFPSIEGETLKDKKVVLPQDTKGKFTLIAVAYSKKSDDLLKGWYSPMYRTFVEPPEVAFIPTDDYDVNMYFVALLKGIYKWRNINHNANNFRKSYYGLFSIKFKVKNKFLDNQHFSASRPNKFPLAESRRDIQFHKKA